MKEETEKKPGSDADLVLQEAEPQSSRQYDDPQENWYHNVYQGSHAPQLTWRAVVTGGILGSLMSISNLYTFLKVGWAFGVAITACVLSFCLWNGFKLIFPKMKPMSILENNCMQSTASAAGYSTGATIATAFGAYLLITGKQVSFEIAVLWTMLTALLGVVLAVPMKQQMINREQLPFPSGIAAAETLLSLYSKSREAVKQAYALLAALVAGVVVGFLSKGGYAWQARLGLVLPEMIPFNWSQQGVNLSKLTGFGFEPSALLIGAGMLVGLRVSLSMLVGAVILYFGFGPWLFSSGLIEPHHNPLRWALWTGTACMVTSGLMAFALQWKTIARSFQRQNGSGASAVSAELAKIEVPFRWFLIAVIPLSLAMIALEYFAFSISIPLGVVTVLMSFILALVACRSTGETDITPIGAMGKVTQLTYAFLAPSNVVTNLMAASVTANTSIGAADLLTDLKSGYLLGANARKQFFAQLAGVFFGVVVVVPAWYKMVPTKEVLESFNPPSTMMWKAVAEAVSYGLDYIPVTARIGILIGGVVGIALALADHFLPRHRKYIPSAMGLGLSWVMPFANSLAFLIGAVIATIWEKVDEKSAKAYAIRIAAGVIAGESLICAVMRIIDAGMVLKF